MHDCERLQALSVLQSGAFHMVGSELAQKPLPRPPRHLSLFVQQGDEPLRLLHHEVEDVFIILIR